MRNILVNSHFCSIFSQALIVYNGKQGKNVMEKVVDHDGIILSLEDNAQCSNPQLKASDDLIYSVIIH